MVSVEFVHTPGPETSAWTLICMRAVVVQASLTSLSCFVLFCSFFFLSFSFLLSLAVEM